MNNQVNLNPNNDIPETNIPNFKEIINYLKCGALIINSSSSLTFEYANEYFYDLIGYSKEEYKNLFNNSISPRIYEDDIQRLRAAISRQLSMGGNTIKYEFRIIKKDGSVAWVMLQGRNSTTDHQKLYASLVDITELKDLYNTVAEKNLELDTLYNNMVGGIIKLSSMDFRVISANAGFFKMIGFTKEEFLHKFNNIFSDIVYRKDVDKLHEFDTNAHNHTVTIRVVTKEGDKCWFYINASRIDSTDDNPIYLCTITDITDNKTYEKNLEVEQKKRNLLAQVSGEIVWEYEYKTKAFTKGHTHMLSLTEQEEKDSMKKNFRNNLVELSLIHPDDIPVFYKFCDDIDNGKQFVEMDIRVKPNTENFYSWFRSVGQTIYDKHDNPVSIVGKTYNTDDTHDALNALKSSSKRDTLTNLYNKSTLQRKITGKINLKTLNAPYAFIIADITDFKKINDSYGHLYGDSVIQEVARIFENICPSNVIGRIGTDVYGILIEDVESCDVISALFDNINFELGKVYNNKDNNTPKITCNFGVNYSKDIDENYEIMFRKADIALNKAKATPDVNHIFFDSSLSYNSADYCSKNEYNVNESFSLLQASMDTALITTAIDLLFDSKDLKGSIKILLDKMNEHFNSEYTRLVTVEPINGESYSVKSLCLPDSYNFTYDTISKLSYEQHSSLFNTDHVLYCSDVNTIKDIAPKIYNKLHDNGCKSVLQCANICDNKFVGYLCLGTCSSTRTWTSNQVRTFSILSKIIFTAMDKTDIK